MRSHAGNHIPDTCVFPLKANPALGLEASYRRIVPEDKMDEVIQILKDYLPGTEPHWYLEAERLEANARPAE